MIKNNIIDLNNKINNRGTSARGRLSAEEFNRLVDASIESQVKLDILEDNICIIKADSSTKAYELALGEDIVDSKASIILWNTAEGEKGGIIFQTRVDKEVIQYALIDGGVCKIRTVSLTYEGDKLTKVVASDWRTDKMISGFRATSEGVIEYQNSILGEWETLLDLTTTDPIKNVNTNLLGHVGKGAKIPDGFDGGDIKTKLINLRGRSLSHINDDKPTTIGDKTIEINYICYSGDMYDNGNPTTHSITLPAATTSTAGLLLPGDKTKLDDIDSGLKITAAFTTELKEKLESLKNYDDTNLINKVTSLQTQLDTLVGSDEAEGAIDTFNEIVNFLKEIEDISLKSIIDDIRRLIQNAQDTADKAEHFIRFDGIKEPEYELQDYYESSSDGGGGHVYYDPTRGCFYLEILKFIYGDGPVEHYFCYKKWESEGVYGAESMGYYGVLDDDKVVPHTTRFYTINGETLYGYDQNMGLHEVISTSCKIGKGVKIETSGDRIKIGTADGEATLGDGISIYNNSGVIIEGISNTKITALGSVYLGTPPPVFSPIYPKAAVIHIGDRVTIGSRINLEKTGLGFKLSENDSDEAEHPVTIGTGTRIESDVKIGSCTYIGYSANGVNIGYHYYSGGEFPTITIGEDTTIGSGVEIGTGICLGTELRSFYVNGTTKSLKCLSLGVNGDSSSGSLLVRGGVLIGVPEEAGYSVFIGENSYLGKNTAIDDGVVINRIEGESPGIKINYFGGYTYCTIGSGVTIGNDIEIGWSANKLQLGNPKINKNYLSFGTGNVLQSNIIIGTYANIGENVVIPSEFRIATSSFSSPVSYTYFFNNGARLGNNTNIGGNTYVNYNTGGGYAQIGNSSSYTIKIGKNTEIGQNVNIPDNFKVQKLTKAQYDALTTKDANTLYFITES